MDSLAVLMTKPEHLVLQRVDLLPPGESDVVVNVEWSGISTGTEKLLWLGRMPNFPGMGYPLVPGYESVGRVVEAGPTSGQTVGSRVFIPGSRGFREVRGLFGGAASRLVTPGARVIPVDEDLGDRAVLLALAATAYHAIAGHPPELIIGHGVLGRLLARITIAMGHPAPNVWELNAERAQGAEGYAVLTPETDDRRDYARICDASGDSNILDSLVSRLRAGGEITLAGFYDRLSFAFAPAFMREASLRIAAEWKPQDMASLNALIREGKLSLDRLITHRQHAEDAPIAYRTAFDDAACLKMVLDWRTEA